MARTRERLLRIRPLEAMVAWLPRGGALEPGEWTARHRGICVVLWGCALLLPPIAKLRGETYLHGLTEAGAVALFAVVAGIPHLGARLRSSSTTVGLLLTCAFVVHLFDGITEAHFLFFVMVAVVALYQAWLPLLLALGFVVAHHAIMGTLATDAVFGSSAGTDSPLLWGLAHGAFILAESLVCLIYWRASERAVSHERGFRILAEKEHRELSEAQRLSGMGSWEWDVASGEVTWSDQLYDLVGVDKATFTPTVSSFLELVHPDDLERVTELLEASAQQGAPLDYECRLLARGGEVITIHALGTIQADVDGTVIHSRGTIHDVTERARLQGAITQMAFQDPLTGLANRRFYLQRLQDALLSHDSTGSCAVLFIDLDGFKPVNDRHGHAAGDALLQAVATRLSGSVRDTDTVARFGGDEFAILCERGDREAARLTARRIEEALGDPILVAGVQVAVAASIGIAVARHGDTADGLLRRADASMYEVKALRKRHGPSSSSPVDEGRAAQVLAKSLVDH